MRWNRPLARALALAAVLALSLPLSGAAAAGPRLPAPAALGVIAATDGEFVFNGHGWGHGRGMGQYGALGYAVDRGLNHSQILAHYYSNTTVGGIGNPEISVHLTKHDGASQIVVKAAALTVGGAPVGHPAAILQLQSDGTILVYGAGGCAGPVTAYLGVYPAGTRISATGVAGHDTMLRVCEGGGGERAFRGSVTVQKHAVDGYLTVFNWLPIEDYLRGVVPRESPASWGSLGGGRGMEALRAQSVAARSYAWSGGNRASGAKTCDTTTCQVYGGAKEWTAQFPAGKVLEAASTDTAIATTAGEVRLMPGGAVARTEFSSSTGGYTVGGAFPAVPDLGDAISLNPNHNWTATLTAAQVAARLGLAGVRSITVTGRNGLGDWGGRVTQVVVVDGSGGSHSYTGAQFRTAMGTSTFKSDWFVVSGTSLAAAESVVKALYQDLLGREPDPTGLAGWSNALLTGTSQAVLVETLTRSDEYISFRVRKAYVEVLGREPEPAGAQGWLMAIRNRQATVDDVQRRFYDSQEYFVASGNTQQGYVQRLYTTVLRRPASPGEVTGWVAAMNQRGRGWVVDAIWFSMEAARIRAGDYYQTFLGRGPDPVGLEAWARVLLSHGEGAVRNGIAGSDEYRQRAIARYP